LVGGWISTIDLGMLEALDIRELGMKLIELDPHESHVAPTNECPRNLGEVYLPVLSSVLSMETVVGKLLDE
jgi:hypothetical protein